MDKILQWIGGIYEDITFKIAVRKWVKLGTRNYLVRSTPMEFGGMEFRRYYVAQKYAGNT